MFTKKRSFDFSLPFTFTLPFVIIKAVTEQHCMLTGTTGGEELWRHCITDTDQVLGFALGSLFVQEVFKGNSKQKV
jgi:predicted metalloendopeptidase